MRIACKVRQHRRHLWLHRAVAHACATRDVGLRSRPAQFLAGPQGVRGGHPVAVRQQLLDFRDVLVAEDEIVRDDAAQVQHERGHGVDLFDAERLGLVPGHCPVDVVPQCRQARQLHESRAARIVAAQQIRRTSRLDVLLGGAPDQRTEDLVRFAEDAVTRRALSFPHLLTLGHRAEAFRKALEIGPHVDVPRCHFGRRRGPTDAGKPVRCLRVRGRCTRGTQGKRHQQLKKSGHS